MLKDTLRKIEDSIQKADSINPEKKKEMVRLFSTLKSEIESLSRTHGEHAQSITGFVDVASHETTRQEKTPHLINLSLDGLSSSVKGFETSHPRLVETVNDICKLLASIGI